MKKIFSLVLILSFASSCTHIPMNESKPVQFEHRFWQGPGFVQDGEFLDQVDAQDKVAKVPEAAEKIRSGQQWGIAGLAVDLVGLGVSIAALTREDSSSARTQYWIGLGFAIFGSLPFGLMANKRFSEAADAYNGARFTTVPKTPPSTQLFLAPVKDGALAGFKFAY